MALALVIVTAATYGPGCAANEFVNYDDPGYITDNFHVLGGLSGENTWWALTTTHFVNWHPLTWLSFQLDAQLFGADPRGYHVTNLLLHTASSVLLFYGMRWLTGRLWSSALVAGLFALHPLHVESVAWAAERKDTLSGLCAVLTVWAYVRYVEQPNLRRYLLVATAFALGLMAKSMLVTLPFVLLLLDYWPLGRFPGTPPKPAIRSSSFRWLVAEKLPLLALAVASGVMTLLAQHEGGARNPTGRLPLRLENAIVSYARYLGKTILPLDLAPFYPFPSDHYPIWQVVGAALLVGGITVLVWRQRRQRPYLLVGWLWFVGMLMPVLGIVQVLGGHAWADRYTYLPLIGVFIMLAGGAAELAARRPALRGVLGAAGVLVLAACAVGSGRQVSYWHDSATLWNHTLAVTSDNYMAQNNLGTEALARHQDREAFAYFTRALEIKPKFAIGHYNLGLVYAERGDPVHAAWQFNEALTIQPDYALAHNGLGDVLAQQGRLTEALDQYAEAVRLAPENATAHHNLGRTLAQLGKLDAAVAELKTALRLHPDDAKAHANLGVTLALQGKQDAALVEYAEVLRLDPANVEVHINLGVAYLELGQLDEAARQYAEAIRLQPNLAVAYNGLGKVYRLQGKQEAALANFQEAARRQPGVAKFHSDLAHALWKADRREEARASYQAALRADPNWPRVAAGQAWRWATDADPRARNGAAAVDLAQQVCEATDDPAPALLDILAAAYAEAGRFDEAQATARQALSRAGGTAPEQARRIEARLHGYEQRQPFHAAAGTNP